MSRKGLFARGGGLLSFVWSFSFIGDGAAPYFSRVTSVDGARRCPGGGLIKFT